MRKARIVMACLFVLAILGGLVAFRANRTLVQVNTTSRTLYVYFDGKTYITSSITIIFCNTINRWVTTVGTPAPVFTVDPNHPVGSTVVRASDGSSMTVSLFACNSTSLPTTTIQ